MRNVFNVMKIMIVHLMKIRNFVEWIKKNVYNVFMIQIAPC